MIFLAAALRVEAPTVPAWMFSALAVLALWGLAGITQKASTNHISAELSFIVSSLVFLPVAACIIWTHPTNWRLSGTGWFLGVLGGLLSGLGAFASYGAYRSGGKASVVTPLAALYPMITVALAIPILHERLGIRQGIGIASALLASWALSYERKSAE